MFSRLISHKLFSSSSFTRVHSHIVNKLLCLVCSRFISSTKLIVRALAWLKYFCFHSTGCTQCFNFFFYIFAAAIATLPACIRYTPNGTFKFIWIYFCLWFFFAVTCYFIHRRMYAHLSYCILYALFF